MTRKRKRLVGMELISVIVPVYNVEKYLDKCVRSIINQTHTNLEIILVDDGSTDNSPRLCDEWTKKDSRIIAVHKKNGGQGEARNLALDYINGQYVGYVDSDDIIAADMYEKLLKLIKKYDADAVQCAMQVFYESEQDEIKTDNSDIETEELNSVQAVHLLLKDKITSTCPSTLLTKNLAKKVLFDTGMINEDVMWMYRICKHSKKTVITSEKLYFYLQRQGSTMNSAYSRKRFDALNAVLQRAEAIKNDFPMLYDLAVSVYVGSCFYHYQTLCRLKKCDEYDKFKKEIFKRYREADLKAADKIGDIKYKLWHTMFRMSPDFACGLRNFLKIGL